MAEDTPTRKFEYHGSMSVNPVLVGSASIRPSLNSVSTQPSPAASTMELYAAKAAPKAVDRRSQVFYNTTQVSLPSPSIAAESDGADRLPTPRIVSSSSGIIIRQLPKSEIAVTEESTAQQKLKAREHTTGSIEHKSPSQGTMIINHGKVGKVENASAASSSISSPAVSAASTSSKVIVSNATLEAPQAVQPTLRPPSTSPQITTSYIPSPRTNTASYSPVSQNSAVASTSSQIHTSYRPSSVISSPASSYVAPVAASTAGKSNAPTAPVQVPQYTSTSSHSRSNSGYTPPQGIQTSYRPSIIVGTPPQRPATDQINSATLQVPNHSQITAQVHTEQPPRHQVPRRPPPAAQPPPSITISHIPATSHTQQTASGTTPVQPRTYTAQAKPQYAPNTVPTKQQITEKKGGCCG